MLGTDREKIESVQPRHGRNGNPPVGATLRDRGGDRVMGLRLVGIAARPATGEQRVNQDAGAKSNV
jgi:hypothetical protein